MSSVPDTPPASSEGQLHFVFGVAPRSGTTYLGDLLALHPHCDLPVDLPEDGFLKSLHKLDAYTKDLEAFWRAWPDVEVPTGADLQAAVGSGLADLLKRRSGAQVTVSKTPYPTNLDRLQSLFPDSRAVVIVRDGRSVTESMVRTWGMRFDMAAALFRDGARSILEAVPSLDSPPPHLHVVKYEDLFSDTQTVLAAVLEFFDLDASAMPADEIADLPVRGSSTARGDADDKQVHWDAVERPTDFNPLDRWADWSDNQHRIFAATAGEENVGLGYEASAVTMSGRAADAVLGLRRAGARSVRRLQPRA